MSDLASTAILGWFLVPWLIGAAMIVRVSVYESKIGLFSGMKPFHFGDLFSRMTERRKIDSYYDRIRGTANRWAIITIVWWLVSFLGIIGGAVVYGIYFAK